MLAGHSLWHYFGYPCRTTPAHSLSATMNQTFAYAGVPVWHPLACMRRSEAVSFARTHRLHAVQFVIPGSAWHPEIARLLDGRPAPGVWVGFTFHFVPEATKVAATTVREHLHNWVAALIDQEEA